ncbi:FAD-dependent monooxygenase [Nonomuraea endophytica]|uniref:FAD-dependent monooxygenase n=1 Tax=Nonomuraea endophytica TaxID=714136 RepID=UPI0037C96DE0
MRIAVVGAGLGGVAAAVGLHRQGHEVSLYERAAELREAGTGVVIMPNGTRALRQLGLDGYVRTLSLPSTEAGLRDWRGRPLLVTEATQAQRDFGAAAVVDRAELHRSLRAPLPDGLVRTGRPIERLEPGPGGVTVISEGRPVETVDAAIAADGVRSKLRAHLFPDHPGPRRTGRMDLRGTLPRSQEVEENGLLAAIMVDRRTGANFGLFPLGDDLLYWYTDTPQDGPPPSPEQGRREVLAMMAGWHPGVLKVIADTRAEDIHVDPIVKLAEPLTSYVSGRIALLGDAAHAMSPDLGQGASQAFEDAAAVTRHLTGAEPGEVVQRLLRYDAERRPRANRILLTAARQSRLTSLTGTPAWVRDALLRLVPKRLATRQLAALWLA